jgi:hypothetical protein
VDIIFFIDLVLSFFRSYINPFNGKEINSHKMIAIRYLKFFFWLDLIPIIPFEVFTDNKKLELLGLLKFLKLSRLLRLAKLKKILTIVNLSSKTKVFLTIMKLTAILCVIIHWVTCIFHNDVMQHYNELKGPKQYNGDFWIPPVDSASRVTTFYQDSATLKYIKLFYYSILIVIGNDMNPVDHQLNMFTICIIIGAFIEAYVMSSFTQEMSKAHKKKSERDFVMDYIKYSMDMHRFPGKLKREVKHFVI